MESESSQRFLGIILEDEEWLSGSTFLYLHRAQPVVPEACYATGCSWALSEREAHN